MDAVHIKREGEILEQGKQRSKKKTVVSCKAVKTIVDVRTYVPSTY